MVIRERIQISAPLPYVWAAFSCLEDWYEWNVACREACFENAPPGGACVIGKRSMLEGDCLSFVISPFIFLGRITPLIVKCVPGEEIVWVGSRFEIHAEHAFTFRESGGEVTLTSI